MSAPMGVDGTSCDHGPHATPESSEGNHRYVDDEEEDEESGDEEVQGARGLAASEQVDGRRHCGVKGG